jgi:hypothetical protein
MPEGVLWKDKRPPKTEILVDTKKKADKQLAHMNAWRIKLVRDNKKYWNFYEILQEIKKVIQKFDETLEK